MSERTLEERQDLRLVETSACTAEALAAIRIDRVSDIVRGIRRAVGDRDASAFGRESHRDRPADAARSAGDERPLAFECAHQTIVSPRSTLTAWPVMFFAWSEARKR